jgi:SAM-dependent methyltransferase
MLGQWQKLARIYGLLGSPLRPAELDIAAICSAVQEHDEDILLLGVTPELSLLGQRLTAVDYSPLMLAHVWPGDDIRRQARLASWVELPFETARFTAVIGDGSLTSVGDGFDRAIEEVRRVLAPEGVAVFRLFCRPERPESFAEIRRDVEQGWNGNIHALKWRVGMAVAAERLDGVVPVQQILLAFNQIFPDRNWLATTTGWTLEEIATLDAFEGADHATCFRTLPEILDRGAQIFKAARIVESRNYPLAELCPIVIWQG